MASVAVSDLNPLPGTGNAIAAAMTQDYEWAEMTLQFTLGGDDVLDWQNDDFSTLRDTFNAFFGGWADTNFYFADMTRSAFAIIDSVSNLDFAESADPNAVDLVVVSTYKPRSSTEGFFQFPGVLERAPNDSWSVGAFNSGLSHMRVDNELGGGAYANWTILHEIGHSLGLKHTHYDGGSQSGDPLAEVGRFMDNERYSVMSYNGASQGQAYGHALSFMALDVAALQALYGAEAYAGLDSGYTLVNAKSAGFDLTENDVQIGRAYYCIWDSGGEDVIDYGNSNKSVMINLNDATLDTSGWAADVADVIDDVMATAFYRKLAGALKQEIIDEWHHAGGFFSRVLTNVDGIYKSQAGGLTIANGVDIENGDGGSKADLLIGNEVGNRLEGFGGNDTLLGSGGGDMLVGGSGRDWLDGGEGDDTLTGGLGNDRFVFAIGSGSDRVADFTTGDRIDLREWGFTGASDLNAILTDDGTDFIFTFATGDSLRISNVDTMDITDFIL
jgi:hypothetical protein